MLIVILIITYVSLLQWFTMDHLDLVSVEALKYNNNK